MDRPSRALAARRCFAALFALLALAAAALALSILTRPELSQPRLLAENAPPQETVETFFNALCRRDWAGASECLAGSPDLGMTPPEEAEALRIWDAYVNSWRWEAGESGRTDDFHAWQKVRFTALVQEDMLAGLRGDVQQLLEQRVQEADTAADVYEENGDYKEEVILAALHDALTDRLERAGEFTADRELTVRLRYEETGWRIELDEALLSALTGTAGEVTP